jgi:hypothetical protein
MTQKCYEGHDVVYQPFSGGEDWYCEICDTTGPYDYDSIPLEERPRAYWLTQLSPVQKRALTPLDPDLKQRALQYLQSKVDDSGHCRGESGVTVGLIDSLIAIARVLRYRNLKPRGVQEALKDLRCDEDIAFLIGETMPNVDKTNELEPTEGPDSPSGVSSSYDDTACGESTDNRLLSLEAKFSDDVRIYPGDLGELIVQAFGFHERVSLRSLVNGNIITKEEHVINTIYNAVEDLRRRSNAQRSWYDWLETQGWS